MAIYITLLSVILASICDACMDTVSFHYTTSIFKKYWPKLNWYFDPSISWLNKYIDKDVNKGLRKFLFVFDYPAFLTDFWHLCKSLMLLFLFTAVIGSGISCFEVSNEPELISIGIKFVVLGLCWNLVFDVFYNDFLIVREGE